MLVCFITWISLEIYIINVESGLLLACDLVKDILYEFFFVSNSCELSLLKIISSLLIHVDMCIYLQCVPLQGELGVREGLTYF